eukprot:5881293-Amphidinium_carterae.1
MEQPESDSEVRTALEQRRHRELVGALDHVLDCVIREGKEKEKDIQALIRELAEKDNIINELNHQIRELAEEKDKCINELKRELEVAIVNRSKTRSLKRTPRSRTRSRRTRRRRSTKPSKETRARSMTRRRPRSVSSSL